MELTVEPGTLDEPTRSELTEFYRDLFGWQAIEPRLFDDSDLLFMTDEVASSFLLLYQGDKAMKAPGFDHLGILVDTRAEVDAMLAKCKARQESDRRVLIREFEDLAQGDLTVHAFYVKFLLPIYFDVQCMEWRAGTAPTRRWVFG
jgi:hypothetical protein